MSVEPVVAITGANGFVGSLLARNLVAQMRVISLVRRPSTPFDRQWHFDMTEREMAQALQLAEATHLIHAAWQMQGNGLEELRRTCVAGTERLMRAARKSGGARVIFISTISAFEGARSAYGKSKLEAEAIVRAYGGLVLRLGLVYGPGARGLFGALSALAARSPVIPLIRGGSGVQFLLDEVSLSEAVRRAVRGDFVDEHRPLTLAHPEPKRLVDLIRTLAFIHSRKPLLIGIPWRMPYLALRAIEWCGIRLPFRSDSLVSFVYQNPAPDFTPLSEHRIDMIPFASNSGAITSMSGTIRSPQERRQ